MNMSVSVKPINYNVYNTSNAKKITTASTLIGAGLGAGITAINIASKKDFLQGLIDIASRQCPKSKVKIGIGAGIAVGSAITVGLSALIGYGIGKLINHFKTNKEADSIKEVKHTGAQTIKIDGKGEFKVVPGHPKKIYKKNEQTGKYEFMVEVYDGSWGKEIPNDKLVMTL